MSSILLEFLYEVDWSEGWQLALLAFHLVTMATILLLHRHIYLQAGILAILAVLCLCTERINEYAAMNYRLFSKEQYFDPGGFFILTVFSGPIIINCLVIVLCWFKKTWTMMVKLGVTKAKRSYSKKNKKVPSSATQPTKSHHQKEE